MGLAAMNSARMATTGDCEKCGKTLDAIVVRALITMEPLYANVAGART